MHLEDPRAGKRRCGRYLDESRAPERRSAGEGGRSYDANAAHDGCPRSMQRPVGHAAVPLARGCARWLPSAPMRACAGRAHGKRDPLHGSPRLIATRRRQKRAKACTSKLVKRPESSNPNGTRDELLPRCDWPRVRAVQFRNQPRPGPSTTPDSMGGWRFCDPRLSSAKGWSADGPTANRPCAGTTQTRLSTRTAARLRLLILGGRRATRLLRRGHALRAAPTAPDCARAAPPNTQPLARRIALRGARARHENGRTTHPRRHGNARGSSVYAGVRVSPNSSGSSFALFRG